MANQRLSFIASTSLVLLSFTLFTLYSNDHPLLTTFTDFLHTIDNKLTAHHTSDIPQLYIVHVDRPSFLTTTNLTDHLHEEYYRSFLPSLTLPSGKQRMVYSCKHAISGFAAWLTPNEVKSMEAKDGFVHAHLAVRRHTHTTYAPAFLGLSEGKPSFWDTTSHGAGVIIGVVDYGIDPTHPSFGDKGVSSPPSKWKGSCVGSKNYCNNKLIGAVGFYDGEKVDALDYTDGHGTNCASTAAGNFVEGASVLGQARGTAAGSAPKAHVAMYKACHGEDGCVDPDIAAAIEQAIEDGVDVLSMSLGVSALPFYNDLVAIGAYSAAAKGIFMCLSVGNSGPSSNTVENHAPWMLIVGASTMDRTLGANVLLGSGSNQEAPYVGESAYQPAVSTDWLPLVYPGSGGDTAKMFCVEGSLDSLDVKGKAVVCHNGGEPGEVGKGQVVKNAGGAAMIVLNQKSEQFTTPAKAHVIPVSHINYDDAEQLVEYVKSSPYPTAKITFEGTEYGVPPSPAVASFSGRGPNTRNGGILKPDIIGPGHNILVATPLDVGPKTNQPSNISRFDITMGTSIATPMLAGVAALLKTQHPDWSPAAIMSAIMTTADTLNHEGNPITDETGNPASLYALGAGHVAPAKANDPGLVYDRSANDYIPYLCGLSGYNDKRVQTVTGKRNACTGGKKIKAEELNYPSIAVSISLNEQNRKLTRTVTNVGSASETYKIVIEQPKGIKVSVNPETLSFSKAGQKITYEVYISSVDGGAKKGSVSEGQLKWVSDKHVVRSPVLVKISY